MTPGRIPDEQRRRRIVARHLQPGTPDEIVAANVVLHSTDPATIYLSVRARNPALSREDIDRALYEQRTLVRHLAMRRTLFVAGDDLVDDLHLACSVDVHRRERARLVQILTEAGSAPSGSVDAWLADLEDRTVEAVADAEGVPAADLRHLVPELAEKVVVERQRIDTGLSTFVLSRLAMAGRIMRGRPRGTWVSGTYHWHATRSWLGRELPTEGSEQARSRLARRWLERFGPATVEDLQWWSGWTKTQARQALAEIDAVPVELDSGEVGHVLPGDETVEEDGDDRIRLLPALDGTSMGWKLDRRSFYLDPAFASSMYDRAGNIGPTIWYGGRVVGAWGQTPDGVVRWRLLRDEADLREVVDLEAAALTAWLDGKAVQPRFPTPLQRELAAGGATR
jgi:hypothetical protein